MVLRGLLNDYEEIITELKHLEVEKKRLRTEIDKELTKTTTITSSHGTTWKLKRVVRRREELNKPMLQITLGDRYYDHVMIKESEVLDIRVVKGNEKRHFGQELRELMRQDNQKVN